MTSETKKTRLELAVDVVKALATWPVFALVVVALFYSPVRATMDLLPDLASRSNTITIGQLTIVIDRSIGVRPSDQVKQVLSDLSPDGIRTLVHLSDSAYWLADSEASGRSSTAELVRLGLLVEANPEQKAKEGYVYGVHITGLGKETQTYLFNLIDAFVHQSSQPQPTPTPK